MNIATNIDEAAITPSHCVFRTGTRWLALPAVAIREVLPKPEMVSIPGASAEFSGLCHIRSEFIPVLNLTTILSDTDGSDHQIMLVLEDMDGPWAVLVDEVLSLRQLNVSDAPEANVDVTDSVVVGWATMDGCVVEVLDQSRIRSLAERRLDHFRQQSGGRTELSVSP